MPARGMRNKQINPWFQTIEKTDTVAGRQGGGSEIMRDSEGDNER
jgi:hypothetical protein